MKNLKKYIFIFIALSFFGLNNDIANAVEKCPIGEKEHTNYYLFLEVNTADYYKNKYAAVGQKPFITKTGADKYNNLWNTKIISQGDVTISPDGKSTFDDWTLEDYWNTWYVAYKNMDKNLVTIVGDNSFFLHTDWILYDEEGKNGQQMDYITEGLTGKLLSYIQNIPDLSTSPLITKATSLPNTTIIPPDNFNNNEGNLFKWNLSRKYDQKDIIEGIDLDGAKKVFSPAAYYIKNCVSDNNEVYNPRQITYYKNAQENDDKVTNFPENITFNEDCHNIDSKIPKLEGYKFLGWSKIKTDKDGDTNYSPGKEYCGKSSLKLYAIWKKVEKPIEPIIPEDSKYKVEYDANKGIGAPKTQVEKIGTCVKISTEKPWQLGHTFLGWSTDSNAVEPDPEFAPNSDYCKDKDVKLYAVWQSKTGINSHFILFMGLIIVSIVAFTIVNKKQLFKNLH